MDGNIKKFEIVSQTWRFVDGNVEKFNIVSQFGAMFYWDPHSLLGRSKPWSFLGAGYLGRWPARILNLSLKSRSQEVLLPIYIYI